MGQIRPTNSLHAFGHVEARTVKGASVLLF